VPSHLKRRLRRFVLCAVLTSAPAALLAGPRTEALSTDLAPLIERAAEHPHRFAVEIPHAATTSSHGEWLTVGTDSVWRYSLQIPGAVSMSFHAEPVTLPASARLRVTVGGADYVYGATDVQRGGLWSRIGRGDTLEFELTVATRELSQLRFAITGVQAGYRGLGADTRNHPHFDRLRNKSRLQLGAAADTVSAYCSENWTCHQDGVTTGPGLSTVALIISNVGQCTGVLLNDVPGDGTPYVLTARHCENGNPDGGQAGAAVSMAVYWDAVVACGSSPGSIYDPGIPFQIGATTVVEQQDAWLVRLNMPPRAADAYYAGWDATGQKFVGGFTAHHAQGRNRQYVGWFGQAAYGVVPAATLGVHFDSTLWGTTNAVGNGGPGGSGSGLFDANGRLTGVVIRGLAQSGADSMGVCPASTPEAPVLQTASSLSTALSGIFSSTADPNSTTGPATIQSVLDPAHTGRTTIDGQAILPTVSLSATGSPSTGEMVVLSWDAAHATSCVATGGESGDGWSGSVGISGSKDLTSYDGGTVTYTLTCSNASRSASARKQLDWALSTPSLFVSANTTTWGYGTPLLLYWISNVRPCTASGGNPGDGWTGSQPNRGSLTVTETLVGPVTYTLTCGTGTRTTSAQAPVTILAPGVQLTADAVSLRPGQSVVLSATTIGGPCVATGGNPGDGWAGNTTFNGQVTINESTPGSYTYSLACGSGANVATAQTTVTFANADPHVTLSASASNVPSLTSVTFNWDANVRPCAFSVAGPESQLFPQAPTAPHASQVASELALGQYVYTVTCGTGTNSAQASKSVTYTGTPRLYVFASPNPPVAGDLYLVQYQGNLAPCAFTGGTPGDGWAGGSSTSPNDNIRVTESAAGTYTFVATCGTGTQVLQAQTTITFASEPPRVVMTVDKTVLGVGQNITITWSSNISPCQATGGSSTDGWAGAVASSGTRVLTETTPNLYFYGVNCSAPPSTPASFVNVNFLQFGPPSFQATSTSAQVGQSVTLTWQSADGSSCNALGGSPGAGWTGSRAASGTFDLRESAAGTYTYSITCGSAPGASLTVSFSTPPSIPSPTKPPPSVQLTANATTVTAGDPVTLTWTTANADSCARGGGNASDLWTGSANAAGGSQQVRESSAGTYTYGITCYADFQPVIATATATVTVNTAVTTPTVTVTGTSGGGGGAMAWLDIVTLAALTMLRRRNCAGADVVGFGRELHAAPGEQLFARLGHATVDLIDERLRRDRRDFHERPAAAPVFPRHRIPIHEIEPGLWPIRRTDAVFELPVGPPGPHLPVRRDQHVCVE
jgi:hypothetical protein